MKGEDKIIGESRDFSKGVPEDMKEDYKNRIKKVMEKFKCTKCKGDVGQISKRGMQCKACNTKLTIKSKARPRQFVVDMSDSSNWRAKCDECGGTMHYFNFRYGCNKCGNVLEV